jgi:hypothetical protein
MLTHEALTVASVAGPMFAVVDALDSVAEIAYAQGRSPLTTHVFALATLLRETHDIPRPVGHAKLYATRIDELRATLGEEAFTTAWNQGLKWSLDKAIDQMNALLCAPETAPPNPNATMPTRGGRK